MRKILIVEEDYSLTNQISQTLRENSYDIVEVNNIDRALELLRSTTDIDLCLLDITTPEGVDFERCKQVRNFTPIPILIMTTNDEKAISKGLESGGDDYITIPYENSDLLGRINTLLNESNEIKTVVRTADLLIDMSGIFIEKNGSSVMLSPIEHKIIVNLINANNKIVKKRTLLEKIWDNYNSFIADSTLNIHFDRLNSKLGQFNGTQYFENIANVGFRWKYKSYPVKGGLLSNIS